MISKAALKVALSVAAVSVLVFPSAAHAQSIIKQPGNHPNYGFEIEPHLALQWADRYWGGDGLGLGARFNIPFVQNGPIKTINNNMGITFGLDVTFGNNGYNCYPNGRLRYGNDGCGDTEVWLPVAMQWNFFLTKVISVFGEPGLAIVHRSWSYRWACPNDPYCDVSYSDTGVEPVFEGGARFMFSDSVGATVRIGYPMITAGVNILL